MLKGSFGILRETKIYGYATKVVPYNYKGTLVLIKVEIKMIANLLQVIFFYSMVLSLRIAKSKVV